MAGVCGGVNLRGVEGMDGILNWDSWDFCWDIWDFGLVGVVHSG